MLKEMLESQRIGRGDLVVSDSEGCTPFHRAASSGNAIAVQAIVKLGHLTQDQITSLDSKGRNALHWAAESNKGSCVCAVFAAFSHTSGPMALVQADRMARSPVHVAAAADAEEALQELNELGAALDAPAGKTTVAKNTIVLVSSTEGSPRLGTVSQVFDEGACVEVDYEDGDHEGVVDLSRCIIAPTPLDFADAFCCARTATLLRKLLHLPPIFLAEPIVPPQPPESKITKKKPRQSVSSSKRRATTKARPSILETIAKRRSSIK